MTAIDSAKFSDLKLSQKISQRVSQILQAEISKGVPEIHRSQVRGKGKTKFAALLVHGLYNSPKDMNDIADYFQAREVNVLNSRLDGHFEADQAVIKNKVRWQTWLEQTREHLELAKQLGEKVILVGHSTGALALTWLTIENPENIEALVWFAPAFRVQNHSLRGVELLKFLNFSFKTPAGRTVSGHAGVEVDKMIAAFEEVKPRAQRQLENIPIWMANTRADLVISPEVAQKFFGSLNGSKRYSYLQPIYEFVSHDSIGLGANRNFKKIMKSMSEFLEFEEPNASERKSF